MGEVTGIGWTDHSWSPWWGCTKVSVGDKGACVNCYAEALDKRVGGDHWGAGKSRREMSAAHWREPLKWNRAAEAAGEQRFVFPSMCDPFDNEVPIEWLRRFLELIRATPHLTWLLLTKRPQNIEKRVREAGVSLPPNAALGATVVTQKEADRDTPFLLKAAEALNAVLTFLSIEPMQEDMDIRHYLGGIDIVRSGPGPVTGRKRCGVDWVICGGESGPRPRPMQISWARSLRDQCQAPGVPFFFKQWGGRTPKANGKELDGREWCERPSVPQKRAA